MAVIFTEQLRNIINHFKSHPEIVDVTVRSVPQDIVIPSKLSNPIQFLFTVLDRSTNTKSVAAVNAGFTDDVGHWKSSLKSCLKRVENITDERRLVKVKILKSSPAFLGRN